MRKSVWTISKFDAGADNNAEFTLRNHAIRIVIYFTRISKARYGYSYVISHNKELIAFLDIKNNRIIGICGKECSEVNHAQICEPQ